MWLLGSIFIFTSLLILYIKYRVVFTGEKCKGKIIDIVEQNAGYVVGGVNVKKHAYIVKIKNKNIILHMVVSFCHWEREILEKKFPYLRMKNMEMRFSNALIFV
ncbi:hypothetical protein LC724_30935 [Blautia sp. RD014234]|nr:hypothetical protein [Blautia parvula]